MAQRNITADSTTVTVDSTEWTADADPYALPDPVTRDADWYVGKITPWQAKPVKARFLATVRITAQPYADAQALIASLPQAFDLDEAVGAQLDVCGQWIGRNRYVAIPLPDTTFALDIAGRGLDERYWRGPYDGADAISLLPDSLYRPLLYAKVLANSWDGLAPSAVAIVTTYLTDPATLVFINDDARAIRDVPGDAIFALDDPNAGLDQGRFLEPGEYPAVPERAPIAYGVCIAGKIPSRVDLAILANDLLPVKGMGADVRISVTTVDGAPLFGLDQDDERIGGLDRGAWGQDPGTLLQSRPL